MGTYIIIALLVVIVLQYALKKPAPKKHREELPESDPEAKAETEAATQAEALPIAGAYQKRWIFSYNEKDAYRKLKETTDQIGCQTLAKVRLLDLLEPVKGREKYKTYFWKVQAKHVDFVLLDEKLVARCIVELDDGSHDAAERKERDRFVDDVLTSVGYKVFHTKAISPEIQQQIVEALGKGEPK